MEWSGMGNEHEGAHRAHGRPRLVPRGSPARWQIPQKEGHTTYLESGGGHCHGRRQRQCTWQVSRLERFMHGSCKCYASSQRIARKHGVQSL